MCLFRDLVEMASESGCRPNHLLGFAMVQKKIMNFYLVINYCQSGHTLATEKKLLRRKKEELFYSLAAH